MIEALGRVIQMPVKKPKPKPKPKHLSLPIVVVAEEAVAEAAYAFYLRRGGEHGHDVDDWMAAERMLRERL